VGLNVIQGLRLSGATRIVAVDTVAAKEELGRQFGATDFVDASAGDAAAAVRALLPPDRERASGSLGPAGGVTWAFDCVGHPAVLRSALDSLDWGGTAVAIGIPPRGTEVAVDVNELAYVDRGLLGCRYGSSRPHHDIPLMIDLYQGGSLMLDELVSLTRPLEEFGEVVEEMHAGRVARGVLTFNGAGG
jgi:S-(hydroxymethyl)glutathione dehydrogenase/alcohol dehydrogenase